MTYAEHLTMVYGAYLLATASPGPSNMAIMATAMQHGRKAGLAIAAGIVTGSLLWAATAATGLSALLAAYADALLAIKICGGLYLIYLAWKAARSALSPAASVAVKQGGGHGALYRRGLLMHLTNPKAIMGWLAIMSLGLQPGAPSMVLPAILAGCAILAILVFGGYAVIFSTDTMVRAYAKARRWIEGTLALCFGYAGLRLLLSRS
jgi:threonine efflux protein